MKHLKKRIHTHLTEAPERLFLTRTNKQTNYSIATSPVEVNDINIEYRKFTEDEIHIYDVIYQEYKKRMTASDRQNLQDDINEILDTLL